MSAIGPQFKKAPELIYSDLPFGDAPVKQEMKEFKLTDTYSNGEIVDLTLASTTALIDFSHSYFTYDLWVISANILDKYYLDDSAHAIIEQYQLRLDDNQTYIDDINDYNVLVPMAIDFAGRDWCEGIGQCIDGATSGAEMLYLPANRLSMASFANASDSTQVATHTGPSAPTVFSIRKLNDYRSRVNYGGDLTTTSANAYGYTAQALNATASEANTTYRQAFRPLGFFRECEKFFPLFLSGKMIFSFRLEDTVARPFAWTGALNWDKLDAACTVAAFHTKNWTLHAKLLHYDSSVLDSIRGSMSSAPIPFPYSTWMRNKKTLTGIQNTEQAVDLPVPALSMRSFFVVPLRATMTGDHNNALTYRTCLTQGGANSAYYQLSIGDENYPPNRLEFNPRKNKEVFYELLKAMSKIGDITTGCRFNEENFTIADTDPKNFGGTNATDGMAFQTFSKFVFAQDLETYTNNDSILSGKNTKTGNPNIVATITPNLAAAKNIDVYGFGLLNAKLYLTVDGSLVWK